MKRRARKYRIYVIASFPEDSRYNREIHSDRISHHIFAILFQVPGFIPHTSILQTTSWHV
jgi:hypothetical protein